MSTGRSEAKRQEKKAFAAAEELRVQTEQTKARAKKQRERAQNIFSRKARARLGGGFLTPEQRGTLG